MILRPRHSDLLMIGAFFWFIQLLLALITFGKSLTSTFQVVLDFSTQHAKDLPIAIAGPLSALTVSAIVVVFFLTGLVIELVGSIPRIRAFELERFCHHLQLNRAWVAPVIASEAPHIQECYEDVLEAAPLFAPLPKIKLWPPRNWFNRERMMRNIDYQLAEWGKYTRAHDRFYSFVLARTAASPTQLTSELLLEPVRRWLLLRPLILTWGIASVEVFVAFFVRITRLQHEDMPGGVAVLFVWEVMPVAMLLLTFPAMKRGFERSVMNLFALWYSGEEKRAPARGKGLRRSRSN